MSINKMGDNTAGPTGGTRQFQKLTQCAGRLLYSGVLAVVVVAGLSTVAQAQTQRPERQSFVEGSVTAQPGGLFRYDYEVFNQTPLPIGDQFPTPSQIIVNWELPLFSLSGIDTASIASPTGWSYEIIDTSGGIVLDANGNSGGQSSFYNNPFGPYGFYEWDWKASADPVFLADNTVYGDNPNQFETPPLLLHWFSLTELVEEEFTESVAGIVEQTSLTGFSFLAEAEPTAAPYEASWFFQPMTIGDPPTPLGAAIGVPDNAAVPEPATAALFAVGLLGLFGIGRRRKPA